MKTSSILIAFCTIFLNVYMESPVFASGKIGSLPFSNVLTEQNTDCPDESIYSQPLDNTFAVFSDGDEDRYCYDDFTASEEICGIHWWGINAPPDPEDSFTIKFYTYDSGTSDDFIDVNPIAEYNVPVSAVDTGLRFNGSEVFYFSASWEHCFSLSSEHGWVSVQGTAGDGYAFMWLKGLNGDGSAYMNSFILSNDFSFCIDKNSVPTMTPTASPTNTPTPQPTNTPTPQPTNTPTPQPTNTPTPQPTNTPTPQPTNTPPPQPTNTPPPQPTITPPPQPTITPTPKFTVTFTPTPIPPIPTVEIHMGNYPNGHTFKPGDICSCTVTITADQSGTLTNNPLFVILDILGNYYFAPGFSDFDYYSNTNPEYPGEIGPTPVSVEVLPEFTWPSGAGTFAGAMWYAAFTNPKMSELYGGLGQYEFGWYEPAAPTSTPGPATPTPPPGTPTPAGWDGDIPGSYEGWMQTMEISQGQTYSITAGGTICFLSGCAHDSEVGPEGWCGVDCSNDTYCAVYQNFGDCSPDHRDPFIQFSHAALLGYEGDNPPADISSGGDVFQIGSGVNRTAGGTGHVWIRINDWRTSDNSRSFGVVIN